MTVPQHGTRESLKPEYANSHPNKPHPLRVDQSMNVILCYRQRPLARQTMMALAMVLLSSCQKKGPAQMATDSATHSSGMPPFAIATELPLAKYSSQSSDLLFREISGHAILATIHDDGYQIDEQPPTIDLAQTEKQIHQRRQRLLKSGQAYLLIAAVPQTPFNKLRELIRSAARAGMDNICFAVKRSTGAANNSRHKLHILLPAACGCGPPLVQPLLIKANDQGDISLLSEPEKEVLDTAPALRDLPLLTEKLSQFSAAARAAGHEPHIQIYVHRETTYQRVIDILSALEQFHIRNTVFTDDIGENEQPMPRPKPNQPLPRNPHLSL